jgi:putative N-acetylmannosamine-6-phosphate epimerase
MDARLTALAGGLIASCQPVRGGVFDDPASVVRFAQAALAGGAVGLRVEGLADVRAVRAMLDGTGSRVPLIGLVKRMVPATDVFITPELRDVVELRAAGADIVAFDATDRPRPVPVPQMISAIAASGALAMADLATYAEAFAARAAGADLIASTLSGYTPGSPELLGPDLALVADIARCGALAIAEGRIATPADAAAALAAGAFAVTIGTAFSRPEWIVRGFVQALSATPPA